ncbi:MAG: hypothetical protein L0H20_11870 [Corynebacterium sp.]|uniref:hypothetical protein n=1 Tax=Corynebacterium sp. TaxID=1720 RepID=UPI002649835C|nr:hypothetical protein [Corynebacterium sp.]MDN5723674.1 hypothetical protein [Corynebacterium sp.]
MPSFENVPLPELDLGIESQPMQATVRRAYSADLEPAAATVERFWSRVVRSPGDGCWIFTGAISGGDGYGRYRAKLHLVDYSTSL